MNEADHIKIKEFSKAFCWNLCAKRDLAA